MRAFRAFRLGARAGRRLAAGWRRSRCSIAAAPASAGEADWPQLGYDGGSSRHNVLESKLSPSSVDGLRFDWMRRVRPDVPFIYEYVADVEIVAGGRVFAAWAGSESPYAVVVAYDEETGKRLWGVRDEHWVQPVAASGSTLIVGVGSRPPSIRALDVVTGTERWSRQDAKPVVADRDVRHVIAVEGGPDGRRVSSVDVSTGDVVWSRRLHFRAQGWATLLISRGLVVVPVIADRGRGSWRCGRPTDPRSGRSARPPHRSPWPRAGS